MIWLITSAEDVRKQAAKVLLISDTSDSKWGAIKWFRVVIKTDRKLRFVADPRPHLSDDLNAVYKIKHELGGHQKTPGFVEKALFYDRLVTVLQFQ